jgi:branched-chain amino acid transport system ATP-binding protein
MRVEEVLLELKNIKVHYGKLEALKGISLAVEQGTILTLIGSNGAGKTTTLNAISGVKKLTSGEIWFETRRIDKMPSYEIVKLGISQIPEGRGILQTMTVLENLELGTYLRSDKLEVAKDLKSIYEHFPVLNERRKQPGGTLSGGEQQMLAIARALLARPKLILMDEPSLGLSPIMVKLVAGIISDINKPGVSIVLVEQNARMALKLAHQAYVLEVGNIALSGEARSLSNNEHVIKAYLGA